MALVVGFVLAGCSTDTHKSEQKPKEAIAVTPDQDAKTVLTKALDTLKAGNLAGFAGYLADYDDNDIHELSIEAQASWLKVDNETAENYLKALYQELEFSVLSVKYGDETATAELEITAVDVAELTDSVQTSFQKEVDRNYQHFANMSEQELRLWGIARTIELLPAAKKITTTVPIELVVNRSGGVPVWKILDSESFHHAIMPGFKEP